MTCNIPLPNHTIVTHRPSIPGAKDALTITIHTETDQNVIQQGYDADHPDIDLLRLRNYTIGRKLTEAEVVGDGGLDRIAELLGCMKPFVSLPFRSAVSALRCGIFFLWLGCCSTMVEP